MIAFLKKFFAAPQGQGDPGSRLQASPNPAAAAPKFSNDDYYHAALSAIHGRLRLLNGVSATLGGGSQSTLDHERADIAKLKAWADGLEDRRYAKAIYGWLEYAEKGAREYEREMRTGEGRKGMAEYRRKCDEENARTREVLEHLPKP